MPVFQVNSAPKDRRVVPGIAIRFSIRKTFSQIIGPVVPKGSWLIVKFDPRSDADILDVSYDSTHSIPQEAHQLVRDAAFISDIGDFEFMDAFFDVSIPHLEMTAHETIEHISEIREVMRQLTNTHHRPSRFSACPR